MGQFYQTLCAKIVTGSQCSVKNLQVSPTFFCHVESATKSGEFCQIFGPFAKLHASKKNIFNLFSQKKLSENVDEIDPLRGEAFLFELSCVVQTSKKENKTEELNVRSISFQAILLACFDNRL
jgi:hypothetical protein